MNISKLSISNLYGITNKVLEPGSVTVFEGQNGAGKTSILDAISLALTNKGVRPRVIKDDAEEGEIQLESSTGLNIHRKKRTHKSDYNRVSKDNQNITSPEAYLKQLFNSNQINPIEFISKKPREQCEILLSMLDIDFTIEDYRKRFGVIPPDYNENMHVLEMLDHLQSNKSTWWKYREEENRAELFKRQSVADNLAKLPENYDCIYWDKFSLSSITEQINVAKTMNQDIENCQNFVNSEDEKKAKIDKDIDAEIETEKQKYFDSKTSQNSIITNCDSEIEKLKERIKMMEYSKKDASKEIEKIESNENLSIEKVEYKRKDSKRVIDDKITKSKEFIKSNKITSSEDLEKLDIKYKYSEEMKKNVTFHKAIMEMKKEQEEHVVDANKFDELINIARALPVELMETATCPIEGLTVENQEVLKDGKPIGNLSEGEQLLLAFDIAMNQVGELKIVLADGFEKLSKNNRDLFLEKAKKSGLQFFITCVADNEEMTIIEM